MMDRRAFIGTAAVGALMLSSRAYAQPAQRLPRVVLVHLNAPVAKLPDHRSIRAFVGGLRDLGWIDGRNFLIDLRSTEGRYDQMPRVMQEVLASPVAVIVSHSDGVFVARRLTDTVPIVAVSTDGLVGNGAASLARPGGNLTGSAGEVGLTEMSIKRLELLKEAAPKVSRVAFLTEMGPMWGPIMTNDPSWRGSIEAAARVLGQTIVWVGASRPEDLEVAFDVISKARANGLLVDGIVPWPLQRSIVEFAARQRLPAIYTDRAGPELGGLMSYAPDSAELWKRAATFVDKILKGAKAGDLPIEQPTKFDLVINEKTAKALGLTIPQSLRLRAEVI
jgi:putative ABC transport system substrate-binding protein